MRRGLAVIALFLSGCPGSKTKAVENGSELVFVPEMDDGFEALKGSLESTVLENYTQLTYNNLEAIVDSLATERELHFLGVTPNDVVIGSKNMTMGIVHFFKVININHCEPGF